MDGRLRDDDAILVGVKPLAGTEAHPGEPHEPVGLASVQGLLALAGMGG